MSSRCSSIMKRDVHEESEETGTSSPLFLRISHSSHWSPPPAILRGETFSPSSKPRAEVGSTRPPEQGTAVPSPLIGCGGRQCCRGRGLPAESKISGPHLAEGPENPHPRKSSQPPLEVPSPPFYFAGLPLNVPI